MKIRGPPLQKNWGRPKTCKIWGDFGQLQALIANISGRDQDIQNRKTNVLTAIPLGFGKKDWWTLLLNFTRCWSTNITFLDVHFGQLSKFFRKTIFWLLKGCCYLKFLHVLDNNCGASGNNFMKLVHVMCCERGIKIWVQIFLGPACQKFGRAKTCKVWRNFGQL